MQLGKTIVGALIGAALGIGLLVVVFLVFHLDRVWLAVPVALLTGLGVRLLVSTSGHPSYARGALTGLFALVAYLFGWWVVAQVATAQSKNQPGVRAERAAPAVAQADDAAEGDDAEADDADEAAPAAPFAASRPAAASGGTSRPAMPRDFKTFDFIWLCVAALIAYELGRGTGGAAPVPTTEDEPMPSGAATAGAHPDA
jgi:hypothetical protein